ncbi:MAG: HAMP domain-containing histidine kinase [Desulfarculaceae bacterium]|nr:HAMP domain-containing histidine kinase [Desulfarculaceae bacterium]
MLCALSCVLVAVLWSSLDPAQESSRQWISRSLWLPLAVVAACFGLRGGLALAGAGSLALVALYGPLTGWPQLMDLAMMWALGFLAGWLVDRHQSAEERQRANQRFTELGRATTTVSHELKNPLGIIGNYAELLAGDPALNAKQNQQLGIILGQVERMRGLLEEVREYSLPLELALMPMDLHALVREVLELMGPASRRVRVRLVDEPWPPAPRVQGDPARLQQLISNLVQNALQASRPGGQVWLSTKEEDGAALLEVIDQGEGLTREEASRIFTPFYTTKKDGTGLGLPICRRIAEAHGGSLELKGVPGKGATARLSLPLAYDPPA